MTRIVIALFCLVYVSQGIAAPYQIDDWLLQREKKGIRIFTKKGKWGKLKDSKAVMHLPDATVPEMVKIITDFDHYADWLPRCRSAQVLARLNENEFIAHIRFSVPWPLKDRDCVVRVKVLTDQATGITTILETSEPKYISVSEGVVRIEQMQSMWRITPKTQGVDVTNEYASNPGGDVPDWLTNTTAVDNPFDIFSNIQSVVSPAQKGKSKGSK
jgi:ribosome-associated toxin RatA of RatAB toxin-antitoxin module